jgi:hypothetical protein
VWPLSHVYERDHISLTIKARIVMGEHLLVGSKRICAVLFCADWCFARGFRVAFAIRPMVLCTDCISPTKAAAKMSYDEVAA